MSHDSVSFVSVQIYLVSLSEKRCSQNFDIRSVLGILKAGALLANWYRAAVGLGTLMVTFSCGL